MTLCPENRSNIAYSAVGSDGVRRPVYSKDVRVFGRVYDMDRMKEFFATQGLNLTNDFENMDIGAIFDGDTKGACSRFGENAALGSCTLHSPYGNVSVLCNVPIAHDTNSDTNRRFHDNKRWWMYPSQGIGYLHEANRVIRFRLGRLDIIIYL